VVLDARGASDDEMLAVAAELGFSETAFLMARNSDVFDVRYFSPLAEVPFCGHATIAAAVASAQRHGTGALTFLTRAGTVAVTTASGSDGELRATLTSVAPRTEDLADSDLAQLLGALRWGADGLDAALPPRVAADMTSSDHCDLHSGHPFTRSSGRVDDVHSQEVERCLAVRDTQRPRDALRG
jgi:PhzF family phenazine biosynthesis protein